MFNCLVMTHIIISASNEKNPDYYVVKATTARGKEVELRKVAHATADYSLINYRLNHLVGRILTQVDASLSDPVQRKAFKDEIRQKFAEEFGFFTEHLLRGTLDQSLKFFNDMSDAEFEEWVKENPPVNIEEVIAPGK